VATRAVMPGMPNMCLYSATSRPVAESRT
jgi:hypothetical protein